MPFLIFSLLALFKLQAGSSSEAFILLEWKTMFRTCRLVRSEEMDQYVLRVPERSKCTTFPTFLSTQTFHDSKWARSLE